VAGFQVETARVGKAPATHFRCFLIPIRVLRRMVAPGGQLSMAADLGKTGNRTRHQRQPVQPQST
jgi:hypothetical protein